MLSFKLLLRFNINMQNLIMTDEDFYILKLSLHQKYSSDFFIYRMLKPLINRKNLLIINKRNVFKKYILSFVLLLIFV